MGRLFKSVVFYALLVLYLLFLMNTWFPLIEARIVYSSTIPGANFSLSLYYSKVVYKWPNIVFV